jgi:ketosteroid isomerase-like protein
MGVDVMKCQKQIIAGLFALIFVLFSSISLSLFGMDGNDRFNETKGCFCNGYMNLEGIFNENNRNLFSIKQFFLDLRKPAPEKIEKLLSNDVKFIINGKAGLVPLAGTYNGKDEVQRYVRNFCASFYDTQMIFQFNLGNKDYINTHVQFIAKVRPSRKTMNIELVYNWMLNADGKIKYLRLYYDTYSWYNAFQQGGAKYIEDFKGDMNFDIHSVNFDILQNTKNLYMAYNTGNIPALMDMLDDDFLFLLKGDPNCVYPGKYYGKNEFLQFVNNLSGVAYYTQPLTPRFYVVRGNHVDYHCYEELVWRSTGKAFTSELVHSLIFNDDGKLLEFKSFNDSFDVFRAAQP